MQLSLAIICLGILTSPFIGENGMVDDIQIALMMHDFEVVG